MRFWLWIWRVTALYKRSNLYIQYVLYLCYSKRKGPSCSRLWIYKWQLNTTMLPTIRHPWCSSDILFLQGWPLQHGHTAAAHFNEFPYPTNSHMSCHHRTMQESHRHIITTVNPIYCNKEQLIFLPTAI